ncbi:MAG: hypothetical protein Q8Q36_02360 [bacterium]|nr:hypothetical protein [bacterium]
MRVSTAHGSYGTINEHKGIRTFTMGHRELPIAVGRTLPWWSRVPYPAAWKPVPEIMRAVDFGKENTADVTFPVSGNAIIHLKYNAALVDIPVEEAIPAIVSHLAEHPALALISYDWSFQQKLKADWDGVIRVLSAEAARAA